MQIWQKEGVFAIELFSKCGKRPALRRFSSKMHVDIYNWLIVMPQGEPLRKKVLRNVAVELHVVMDIVCWCTSIIAGCLVKRCVFILHSRLKAVS